MATVQVDFRILSFLSYGISALLADLGNLIRRR